jgi:lipoprotein-anchoring transpeptidase ErfK/SrfK
MQRLLAFVHRRRLVLAIAGGACLILGIGVAILTTGSTPSASVSPSATPSPSVTPNPTPSPSSTAAPAIEPGDIVATSIVESLKVYDEPGATSATRTLGPWSYYGQPLTLLGIDTSNVGDEEWIEVKLPVEPNGSTGWIRASDVSISSTDRAIYVYLDEHVLEYVEGDTVVLTTTVAIGKKDTPTPPGLYYITDPLDFTANPYGLYGAYALGLSGFSEVLKSFDGGPPQLAIHGTNQPQLLGQSVSNGCIRVANDAILDIAATATLGTPVIVLAERP